MSEARLLSIPEAATYLGVSNNTMREYAKTGVVPTVPLPARAEDGGGERRNVLIDREDLDRLIEDRKRVAETSKTGTVVGTKPAVPSGKKRKDTDQPWYAKYANKRI